MRTATHYIGMAGLHGCMPATCDAYDTAQAAAESLDALHDLSQRKTQRLQRDRYIDLDMATQGNEYAEIEECDCIDPAQHNAG